MPLTKSKEGHESRVIQMGDPEREQFGRFLCLLGSEHNRWLNSIMIDVETTKDILYYLHACVKE